MPADDYAEPTADGREHFQAKRPLDLNEALRDSLIAYRTSPRSERIRELQTAGIASRKAGDIYRSIDELGQALNLAERDGTDCLLIARVYRDLAASYQTLFNRRLRIEDVEDRDTVASATDDLQVLAEAAYKRADAYYSRSDRILFALANESTHPDGDLEQSAVEHSVTAGFHELLKFQRSRFYSFQRRRYVRHCVRYRLRRAASELRLQDNRVYELNNLKRVLRVSWWFQRPYYLVRALYLVLRKDSESRGDLMVVLASALGDRVALHFEMAHYPDELIIGKELPVVH